MRGRRAVLAAAAGLALLAGACGDDDDATDAQEAADEAIDASDGPDVDDLAEALDLLPEDCEFLLSGAFLDPAAALTPGGTLDFEQSRERFDALAREAPEEIRADLEVMADRHGRMAEALADVDLDDPQAYGDEDTQAALAELETVFDDEYEDASQKVGDYVTERCSGG
jgi:hypothetical protein